MKTLMYWLDRINQNTEVLADKVLFGDAIREWETQPSSEAQSLASAHFDRYRAAMGMRNLVTDAPEEKP